MHFLQTLRRAYPVKSVDYQDMSSGSDEVIYNSAPPTIPILILRPFAGELEHSTRRVVQKLQKEGDRYIHWIDTTGWVQIPVVNDESRQEVWRKDRSERWRLTPQGMAKLAVNLKAHIMPYLVEERTKSFLPHQMYAGQVHVPETAQLDRILEDGKLRVLTETFWPTVQEETPPVGMDAIEHKNA